jgi:hypothetical protein
VLKKLGREAEALDAVWTRYREHPSRYRYDDLLRFVPKAERPAWHEKAVEAATETDLYSLVELLVHTREIDRLGELIARTPDEALEGVSHYALEPAASKLSRRFPAEAARLWRALAMRILDQGKSRYYDAALEHLERARKGSLKAGRPDIWEGIVSQVRERHRRKTGFMHEFERIASGSKPRPEPSFLERAKARWDPA